MIRLRHKLLIHSLRFIDQMIVFICLAVVSDLAATAYGLTDLLALVLLVMASVYTFDHFVRYDANRFTALTGQLVGIAQATTAMVMAMLAIRITLASPALSPQHLVVFGIVSTVLLMTSRIVVRELLKLSRRSGLTSRQLLIIGCNVRARRLAQTFDSCPELGYRIQGFVSETDNSGQAEWGDDDGQLRSCGHLSQLQSILEQRTVDEVLVCLPLRDYVEQIAHIIRLGEQLGIVVRIIPGLDDETPILRRMHLEMFDDQCVVTFFRESLLLQLLMKRIVDVVVSFTLLVLLSPLLLVVAMLIRLTSQGPALFVQERVGMNRRRFRMYKFRSMSADADRRQDVLASLNEMDGPVFKIANDPRVTPIGRFIRRTSIDELPQLLNVLGGSMSLVGPRPPVPSEVEQYDWLYHRRLSIRPGITCLWQVSGRNRLTFKQWMELDKEYVINWSLWLDLKILWKTIPAVFMGRGAY